ncbi:hypothetical protein [Paralimibaculum aggregatum]|nr:hypothetical protein [Limibaculum sp. NKW23]
MPRTDTLPEAARLLLAELEERTRWQAELSRELAAARRERETILSGLQPVLRGLPEAVRAPLYAELGRIGRLLGPSDREIGRTPRARAALGFLAQLDYTEIRAAELNFYLRRQGFDCAPRYAARLLDAWRRAGIVERIGHGLYRLVMGHPAVARIRLLQLEAPDRGAKGG